MFPIKWPVGGTTKYMFPIKWPVSGSTMWSVFLIKWPENVCHDCDGEVCVLTEGKAVRRMRNISSAEPYAPQTDVIKRLERK